MASSTAGVVMMAGSALFFFGAGIGVPRVFTEPDPKEKLRMLEERQRLWRLSQPFYAVGALMAAVGVGFLSADSASGSRTWLAVSCGLLVIGALSWSWSVSLRTVHPREFALGELPGWPFAAYVWLTLAGLLLLGVGILLGGYSDWLGWFTLGVDALYLVAYLRYRDIPPFVFYLLLSIVGIGLL